MCAMSLASNTVGISGISACVLLAGVAGSVLPTAVASADECRTQRRLVVKERDCDRDRPRVSVSLGINSWGSSFGTHVSSGWSRGWDRGCDTRGGSWGRYDGYRNGWDRGRCGNDVVIVDRPCPPPVVVMDRPCPPPVVVVDRPCPPRTVVVERPCPPRETVIVRETEPARTVVVQQATYVTERPAPDTSLARERAGDQLRAGRFALATDLYRLHLQSQPDDAVARRSLAFTHLSGGRIEDAVTEMATAYDNNPRLGRSGFTLALLPDGGSCLGARYQEVRDLAERTSSSSAYLTAAVIAQSIGNYDNAANMFNKARERGLSQQVASEITLSVTSIGRQ